MTRRFPERIAMFAGSFNPFTIGHASIVERALDLFDRIVIAVGVNAAKMTEADMEGRVGDIEALYVSDDRVSVISFSGLAVDAARSVGACALVRGVRSVADFEYERQMADINHTLTGIETLLLFALPEYESVSSSIVRELRSLGVDVERFLPKKQNDVK